MLPQHSRPRSRPPAPPQTRSPRGQCRYMRQSGGMTRDGETQTGKRSVATLLGESVLQVNSILKSAQERLGRCSTSSTWGDAKSQLNQCCEWRKNDEDRYVWRITSMPWKRRAEDDRKRRTEDDRTQGDHTQGDHTQGDRSRGPSSVDSQATMKNFKAFRRYLFTDENILYILFILGRALCWSKHPTPPLPIMPSQVKHKGPRRQPTEFEAKRIRHTSSGC